METPLGLYLSVPFCRGKCTFCNFASDAFAPGELPGYVDALCSEMEHCRDHSGISAALPSCADTLYFGGGTPSLLSPQQIDRVFTSLRNVFSLHPEAEITVECAPGQLAPDTLEALQRNGVNRLSFGVQSFVDAESVGVGRHHTGASCLSEIARVRRAGIPRVGLDLIAGLPHQTEVSWRHSLECALESGADHISVYLLEIDEDSRLGEEILRGGHRYAADRVPSEEEVACFYEVASDLLPSAGVEHYEISNFSRPGFRSAHNLKYWERLPYLGFGLDAHSMLRTSAGDDLRFSNTADLPAYVLLQKDATAAISSAAALFRLAPPPSRSIHKLTADEAFEETLFLGLRLTDGLDLAQIRAGTPPHLAQELHRVLACACEEGLLSERDGRIALTPSGRLLSNELFSRLLLAAAA